MCVLFCRLLLRLHCHLAGKPGEVRSQAQGFAPAEGCAAAAAARAAAGRGVTASRESQRTADAEPRAICRVASGCSSRCGTEHSCRQTHAAAVVVADVMPDGVVVVASANAMRISSRGASSIVAVVAIVFWQKAEAMPRAA